MQLGFLKQVCKVFTLLVLVGCSSLAESPNTAQGNWINEIILNELLAMRQEIVALSREVGALKTELQNAQRDNKSRKSGAVIQRPLNGNHRVGNSAAK